MSKITKITDTIIQAGLSLLVFLTPLFFLPTTSDFYDFNKNSLLFVTVAFLVTIWLIKMGLEQKTVFRLSTFDLPIILTCAAYLLSLFLEPGSKTEALAIPGGGATIISLTLAYFLITNNLSPLKANRLLLVALASSSLLGLLTIYQYLGIGQLVASTPWLKSPSWTPTGSLAVTAAVLIPSVIILGKKTWTEAKLGLTLTSGLFGLGSLLATAGLLVSLTQLFGSKPVMLPLSTSWAVAIESIKNSPLWGAGPASFASTFLRYRPADLNSSPFWNVRFSLSGNHYLQLLTTVGLVGLAGFLSLVWKIINTGIKLKNSLTRHPFEIYLALLAILVTFFFIPAGLSLLFWFYLLLGLLAVNLPGRELHEPSRLLPWVILTPLVFLFGFTLYHGRQIYLAEMYYKKSIDAIAQNQGTQAYQNQIKAIDANPAAGRYRLAYSQTNLALANSLAASPNLSDQDRSNIITLIQQAISEAKAAVSLDPENALAWENLALVYRQLINLAQGADQWSVVAYQHAVTLNPNDPNLSLNLGGVYYALKNYPEAAAWFQRAINLKSDFANAHYNLAATYREQQDFARAVGEMEVVLRLVEPSSGDFQKAQMEMTDLKAKLTTPVTPSPEQKPAETLSQPSPIPSPIISPPIELPLEEIKPPETSSSQSALPIAVTATPTPQAPTPQQ